MSHRHDQALSRRRCLQGLGAALCAAGMRGAAGAGAAPGPYRLTADFDPVAAVWLGFAHGHDTITAELAAALQPHATLKYLLRDPEDAGRLQALLGARGVAVPRVQMAFDRAAGYFMRDQVLLARGPDRLGLVGLRSSLYGTPAWCRRRHADDGEAAATCTRRAFAAAEGLDTVDREVARQVGAAVIGTPLGAEGGGVEVNGRGLLIANEPYWASRNPDMSREQLQQALLALPGIAKVIWLGGGLAEDVHLRGTIVGDHVAWGTGGHTDQFVRFADERTVLLAWPGDEQAASHPVSRLTRERMARNLAVLQAATDLRGRRLRVLKVPMPRLIEREVTLSDSADVAWSHEWTPAYFAPHEGRRQGGKLRQVATATWLNFVVVNGVVVLPDYTRHGTPPSLQGQVRRIFASAFPGRQIRFVDAITANWVGGGLHCATAHEPPVA